MCMNLHTLQKFSWTIINNTRKCILEQQHIKIVEKIFFTKKYPHSFKNLRFRKRRGKGNTWFYITSICREEKTMFFSWF